MSDKSVARRVHFVTLALVVTDRKVALIILTWRLQHCEVRRVDCALLVHVFDEKRT